MLIQIQLLLLIESNCARLFPFHILSSTNYIQKDFYEIRMVCKLLFSQMRRSIVVCPCSNLTVLRTTVLHQRTCWGRLKVIPIIFFFFYCLCGSQAIHSERDTPRTITNTLHRWKVTLSHQTNSSKLSLWFVLPFVWSDSDSCCFWKLWDLWIPAAAAAFERKRFSTQLEHCISEPT